MVQGIKKDLDKRFMSRAEVCVFMYKQFKQI